jgi:glucose/arabinose dehydrogenase
MRHTLRRFLFAIAILAPTLAGCGDSAKLTEAESAGSNPKITEPRTSLIPTVAIAAAAPWKEGEKPKPAEGLEVNAFATGLDHPRWIYGLPNGDVLVAESNAPPQPDDAKGLKGWIYKIALGWAGAAVKSANRITLLRDNDGDGVAETRSTLLSGLNSPFGIVLVGNTLYVANTDAVMAFDYAEGAREINSSGMKVADLPAGRRNHHWTKNIIADASGKLLVTVGSNSNAGENGIDAEHHRACILVVDPKTGNVAVYASGLRNPNGLAFEPATGKLWTVVNERDELGSDLVPDYLTEVVEGAFYGFPWSYWGQHVDKRMQPERPDLVQKARVPDYALGNHVAPLGLAFSTGAALPERFDNVAFVGEHGSWNRRPPSGYKVVAVKFEQGRPVGQPIDVLTGFLSDAGEARGRPVGVIVHRSGALLVADDVGNTIWRLTGSRARAER